jgi:hypothetical protein
MPDVVNTTDPIPRRVAMRVKMTVVTLEYFMMGSRATK